MNQKECKFKIGDIVQLKSGSLNMTVADINDYRDHGYEYQYRIRVAYNSKDDKDIITDFFPENALKLANEINKSNINTKEIENKLNDINFKKDTYETCLLFLNSCIKNGLFLKDYCIEIKDIIIESKIKNRDLFISEIKTFNDYHFSWNCIYGKKSIAIAQHKNKINIGLSKSLYKEYLIYSKINNYLLYCK